MLRSGGITLAIDAGCVRAVRGMPDTTRIPHASRAVLGVFHHEGRIAALVDLHTLCGSSGPAPQRPAVLVIEHEARLLGLVVAHAEEVIDVPGARLTELPPGAYPRPLSVLVTGIVRPVPTDPQPAVAAEDERPPRDPRLAALLTEAPEWLARIHDPDPRARREASARRALDVLGTGDVLLLDPDRIWNTVAGRRTSEVHA